MKKIHFMGIGGAGASSVAAIARSQGFLVTGCDKVIHNEFTLDFDKSILFVNHSPSHLFCHPERSEGSPDKNSKPADPSSRQGGTQDDVIDILAISPAITVYDPENEELQEARRLGVEIMTWQEFMGKFLENNKFVIAVSGTHGKSTTTAMIGQLLEDAGLDPTVEMGAIVPEWGKNYRVGKSKYFVTEADEYNDNFLVTHPDISVVTSIEMDHPEFFKDFEDYKNSFEKFLLQTKSTIVANIANSGVAEVTKGVMKKSKVAAVDYSKSEFNLDLKVLGKHNLLNAQAAFQVGLILGIDPEVIRQSLNNFSGIGRRLELIGQIKGAEIYSDFGHHPTEIKVSVGALREKYPDKKLWVIFQPHMFSRTRALFNDFVNVFKELPVEKVEILDIYHAREKDPGDISSKMLVEAINKPSVRYDSSWEELKGELEKDLGEVDLVVFMGAGDTDKWAKEFVSKNPIVV